MKMPLVSIVIPVFNGSRYLKECIDSAINQTYQNIEIIVVNDGSIDKGATEKIALSYGDKIRYIYKTNGGVSSALNCGIEAMNGEWFSWLSHDDVYDIRKVESQIESLNKVICESEKYIIASGVDYINEFSRPIKLIRSRKDLIGYFNSNSFSSLLLRGRSINGCALLIPREALAVAGGFSGSYKFIQDFSCWLEISLSGYGCYFTKDLLVHSRVHAEQQTTKIRNLYYSELSDLFDKKFTVSRSNVDLSINLFRNIVFFGAKNGLFFKSIKYIVIAKIDEAHFIKYLVGIAELIHGSGNFCLLKAYRMIISFFYRM